MQAVINQLLEDSRSLWVPKRIQEYNTKPTGLSFLRDHVSQSVPCVWRGAAREWKAVERWGDRGYEYLRRKVGRRRVRVGITPDGRADAVLKVRNGGGVEKVFASGWEIEESFAELLDGMVEVDTQHGEMGERDVGQIVGEGWVRYYSGQDGSLQREVAELGEDLGDMQFAKEAFGEGESLVNIWVGDGRSLTSMHADPFENLYVVVKGLKVFEIRAPCDGVMVRKEMMGRVRWMPNGEHFRENGEVVEAVKGFDGWKVVREGGCTEWIDEEEVQGWGECLRVEVGVGDMLYLPGLWFHRVRQCGVTIAVNWWFDMVFGRDWVYKELCANVGKAMDGIGEEKRKKVAEIGNAHTKIVDRGHVD